MLRDMRNPHLIGAADLLRIGRDPRELATRQHKGELTRVHRGVYIDSREWDGLSPKARYGLRALAFQQLAGSPPVFCHASAALLWGLWIVGTPQKLHVITEATSGGRSRNGIVRHIGSRQNSVVQCGPFAVTDKLTTTMALINSLAFPYAVAACDSSLRAPRRGFERNQFGALGSGSAYQDAPAWDLDVPQGPPLQLAQLVDAAYGLPSKAARDRALAVINFSSGLSGSAGESMSRVAMFVHGFPLPTLQRKFILRDGRDAFVDFWFEDQRLAGEFDGHGKYLRADWGGGLSIQQRVMAEKQREDQIRAQGVGFVRWVWDEMMDAERFQQLLRQAGLPQR
jgi:hypothetical protein